MRIKKLFSGTSDGGFAASGPGARKPPVLIGTPDPVQTTPQAVMDRAGKTQKVFVDTLVRHQDRVIVLGWATVGKAGLTLLHAGRPVPLTITRHARGDVAEAMGLSSGEDLGFVAMTAGPVGAGALALEITVPRAAPLRSGPLAEKTGLSDLERSLVPALQQDGLAALRGLEPGSPDWWALLETFPEAAKVPTGHHGLVEGLLVSPEGDGVAHGWALHPEDAIIWLEDDENRVLPLSQVFRRTRRDITAAFRSVPWADMEAAFVAHLPGLGENPRVRMRVATAAGVATIGERAGAELLSSTPRQAAERLFEIETEERLFHRRAALVDWPVLAPLIAQRQVDLTRIVPLVKRFGSAAGAVPEVSIVVPLYRRHDFMEHQILEFLHDPDIRERAELIYVVDDPDIQEAVLIEADSLFRLYGLPFTVVAGLRNRGFSGANNLGADHARGRNLLFLNSDVIPIRPGWLGRMLAALKAWPDTGIVGARLLFPGGGIQHAGMDFEYLPGYGIWSNQHPGMGLDPALDEDALREVPAVTGACLLIPRAVFDRVGGWDTGYLLGDFEDSDLCFSVRQAGLRILYQPAAELTHLERQSFSGIGGDAFRIRMTICNAVRHQDRWAEFLDRPASAAGAEEADDDFGALPQTLAQEDDA